MRHFLIAAALLVLSALPAQAGVYVTDQPDAGFTFCQAVANTRAAYCPNIKVDCKAVPKKKVAFMLSLARTCNTPTVISEKDAAQALADHSRYQAALCCPDTTKDKPKKKKHKKKA